MVCSLRRVLICLLYLVTVTLGCSEDTVGNGDDADPISLEGDITEDDTDASEDDDEAESDADVGGEFHGDTEEESEDSAEEESDADVEEDSDADVEDDSEADSEEESDADTDTEEESNGDTGEESNADIEEQSDADTSVDSDDGASCPAPAQCMTGCLRDGGTIVAEGTCSTQGEFCCDLGTTDDDTEEVDDPSDTSESTDTEEESDTNEDSESGTDKPVVEASAENTGANCDVSAGSLESINPDLPDPFAMNDGTRISTMEEWKCRRNEIKKDLEEYEIGPKPDPPEVSASYSGGQLQVTVTTGSGSITLSSSVSGSGPCVVIGMNGTTGLLSGCMQVPFMHDQVVKYAMSGGQSQGDPFYKVYPDLWGKVGDYAAWSWGVSRLIDGLDQMKDLMNVDMSKIAVTGCSYAGKMALFAGAFDERVALTIPQESGGGGIVSWRLAQDFTDRTGVNVEKIDNTSTSWFMPSMRNLDPHSLPHDHHELVAMVAPRAFVTLGNPPYEWLGDESGYKSVMAAKEVWKAMGVEDRIGFDFSGGHSHCQTTTSQSSAVKAFVDKFLLDNSGVDTNIAVEPNQSGFNLDWEAAVDWDTPTIQ